MKNKDRLWELAMNVGSWVILGLSIVFAVVIISASRGWIP